MITLKEQLCRCEHLKGKHTFCGCGVDLCECGQFAIKEEQQRGTGSTVQHEIDTFCDPELVKGLVDFAIDAYAGGAR